MRQLPPLSALKVFEVAARTSSYVEAGVALGLTPGAVSRQVATREAWGGQRLFVRVGRRMVATEAARVFAAEVSRAFDRVTSAAEACGKPASARPLRISAPTTFAMRWLIPRLAVFEALRPEAEVTVTTVTTLHDELRGGFDLAIRRGAVGESRPVWPQHRATAFLDEGHAGWRSATARRGRLSYAAIPIFRPALIDVSAMANVAGPGLALATNDATRMRGRLT